jgi:hypothetical protein
MIDFEIRGRKYSYPSWKNHDSEEYLRNANDYTATLESENHTSIFAENTTTTPNICNDESLCLYKSRSSHSPTMYTYAMNIRVNPKWPRRLFSN